MMHRVSGPTPTTPTTTVRAKTRARAPGGGINDDDGNDGDDVLLSTAEAGTGAGAGAKTGIEAMASKSTQETRQGFTTHAPHLLQHLSDLAATSIQEREAVRLGLAPTHTTNSHPHQHTHPKFAMLERLYGEKKTLGGMGEGSNEVAVTTTATTTATDTSNASTKAARSPTKPPGATTSKAPIVAVAAKPPVASTKPKAPISALAKQIRALFAEQERAQAQELGLGLAQGQGLGSASGPRLGLGLGANIMLPPSNMLLPPSNGRALADMMCVNPSKTGNVLLQSNDKHAQSNDRLTQSNDRWSESNDRLAQSNDRLPSIHPFPSHNGKETKDTGLGSGYGSVVGAGVGMGAGMGMGVHNSRHGKGGQRGPMHRKWGLGYHAQGQRLGQTIPHHNNNHNNNNNNNNNNDDDDDMVDEVGVIYRYVILSYSHCCPQNLLTSLSYSLIKPPFFLHLFHISSSHPFHCFIFFVCLSLLLLLSVLLL